MCIVLITGPTTVIEEKQGVSEPTDEKLVWGFAMSNSGVGSPLTQSLLSYHATEQF